ncbi:uncharacterized protein LOC129342059 [Eublepharis macularius]|uniref:Uncharacterized protein LOC129342059 n=1 Tax=Eublepharis macularius TaxID=481883 RepID=A0AA97LEY9_EUBMA|nr:uncharacterized protein LOC129342059 [Eublepharis macularius]
MRGLVKKKLKGQKGQNPWGSLETKTTILKAQKKYIQQVRKGTNRYKKRPAWLTNKVKEARKGKKVSFKGWKASRSEVYKREHRLWQRKCKSVIRQAKRDYEEHIAKNIKTNNKHFFKYIRSRKPAREAVGPLDDQGVKGLLKNNREMAEKLHAFFASVFTVEDERCLPTPEPLISGGVLKDLSQIEVMRKEVLRLISIQGVMSGKRLRGGPGGHPADVTKWNPSQECRRRGLCPYRMRFDLQRARKTVLSTRNKPSC